MQNRSGAETAEVAWREVQLAAASLTKAMHRRMAATGVTPVQAAALGAIAAQSGPVTVSRLARELHEEPQSLTELVDRLERRGWVRRERDLADRRVVRVELTAAGAAKLAETRAPSSAAAEHAFACLSPAERRRLAQLLRRLHEHTGQMAEAS